jgi:hypothetical protein
MFGHPKPKGKHSRKARRLARLKEKTRLLEQELTSAISTDNTIKPILPSANLTTELFQESGSPSITPAPAIPLPPAQTEFTPPPLDHDEEGSGQTESEAGFIGHQESLDTTCDTKSASSSQDPEKPKLASSPLPSPIAWLDIDAQGSNEGLPEDNNELIVESKNTNFSKVNEQKRQALAEKKAAQDKLRQEKEQASAAKRQQAEEAKAAKLAAAQTKARLRAERRDEKQKLINEKAEQKRQALAEKKAAQDKLRQEKEQASAAKRQQAEEAARLKAEEARAKRDASKEAKERARIEREKKALQQERDMIEAARLKALARAEANKVKVSAKAAQLEERNKKNAAKREAAERRAQERAHKKEISQERKNRQKNDRKELKYAKVKSFGPANAKNPKELKKEAKRQELIKREHDRQVKAIEKANLKKQEYEARRKQKEITKEAERVNRINAEKRKKEHREYLAQQKRQIQAQKDNIKKLGNDDLITVKMSRRARRLGLVVAETYGQTQAQIEASETPPKYAWEVESGYLGGSQETTEDGYLDEGVDHTKYDLPEPLPAR